MQISADTHGWYAIPLNEWDLYLTEAQQQCLFENYDAIQPVSVKANIAHTIPMAKYPGRANTTQLSFNNTIYSLLYECHETDFVRHGTLFPTFKDLITFARTFDGASVYDAKTRLNLPQPDLYYKIPRLPMSYDDDAPVNYGPAVMVDFRTFPQTGTIKPPTSTNSYNQPLDEGSPKLAYYPEFLQNNEKVSALYPGENMAEISYNGEGNKFSHIDCAAVRLGEPMINIDFRNLGMNTANLAASTGLQGSPVFPIVNGDTTLENTYFQNFSESPLSSVERYHRIFKQMSHSDEIGPPMPQWYIKGIPILEADSNLVEHTFCATVTHSITI